MSKKESPGNPADWSVIRLMMKPNIHEAGKNQLFIFCFSESTFKSNTNVTFKSISLILLYFGTVKEANTYSCLVIHWNRHKNEGTHWKLSQNNCWKLIYLQHFLEIWGSCRMLLPTDRLDGTVFHFKIENKLQDTDVSFAKGKILYTLYPIHFQTFVFFFRIPQCTTKVEHRHFSKQLQMGIS